MSLPKKISHKLSLNTGETLGETLVHSENVKSTLVLNPENCHYSPYVPTNTKDCFVNSPVNTDENTFTGNTDRLKHTNKPTKTLPFPKVFTNSLTRNNVHPDPWPSVDVNTAPETEKNSTDVLNVKLPGDSKSFVVVRKHSESEEASETSSVIVSDSHETIVNTARDEVSEKGKVGEKINSEQQTNQQTKTVIGRTTKSTNETTITKQQEIFEQQKNILTDEQKTLEEPNYEKLGAKPKNPEKVFKKVKKCTLKPKMDQNVEVEGRLMDRSSMTAVQDVELKPRNSGQHRYEDIGQTTPGHNTEVINQNFAKDFPILTEKSAKNLPPNLENNLSLSPQLTKMNNHLETGTLTPIRGKIPMGKVTELRLKFEREGLKIEDKTPEKPKIKRLKKLTSSNLKPKKLTPSRKVKSKVNADVNIPKLKQLQIEAFFRGSLG